MGIRDDGTYDILYDDGDGESAVPRDRIRAEGEGEGEGEGKGAGAAAAEKVATAGTSAVGAAAATASTAAQQKESARQEGEFPTGSKVEMRSHKTKQWVMASVGAYDAELGTYDLVLLTEAGEATGSVEKGVPLGLIRKPKASSSSSSKVRSRSKDKERRRSRREEPENDGNPTNGEGMDKASRRARKRKMKYIARIQEVLLNFSDKELESALQVVNAMDAIRGGASEKTIR